MPVLLPALLLLPPVASAAEIFGRVLLSGEPAGGAVVSIEGLRTRAAEDSGYVIDHRDLHFTPHVLLVRDGSTVLFKNSDGMPCRIYSISPAGTFALRRESEKPVTVKFDRPGVIELRCADHPRARGFIVIKENPYFALTDSEGRYELAAPPAGRYTLQAWYEGSVVGSKTIRLGGGRLKVDVRASRPESASTEGLTDKSFFANILNSLETIR